MKPDLSLSYVHKPARKPHEKSPLVIMLHGYGSHENDLFEMAQALPEDQHYLSLRAPHDMGFGGFAWYALSMDGGQVRTADPAQARRAMESVHQFVQEYRDAFELPNAPLHLLGFSQGAILAYAYTFNYPREVQRLIAMSGYVLKSIVPDHYRPEDLRHLRLFVSHGKEDQVIPIQAARKTVAFLEKLGISHQYQEYNAGHGVAPENFRDLQQWYRGQSPQQKSTSG